jgi:TetR/AcrR family transcriptional repressor of nem operon
MRVSKEKAAENRDALLQAASRLFRERGIDGVGVAEIAKAAGLTHGALYAHFPSKDALVAEAFAHGFAGNMAGVRAWAGDRLPSFDEYLALLFSTGMRDRLETGCPMAASASEIARQGEAAATSFARAFEEMVAMMAHTLDDVASPARRRQLAVASAAAQIGAIAVSRAVAKIDEALSEEVLRAVHETVSTAHGVASSGQDTGLPGIHPPENSDAK